MATWFRLLLAIGWVVSAGSCAGKKMIEDLSADSAVASGGSAGVVSDSGSEHVGVDAPVDALTDVYTQPDCELPLTSNGCSGFIAEQVVKFVYCREKVWGAYVPPGLYTEPLGPNILSWFEPCSSSQAQTHQAASNWAFSTLAPSGSPIEFLSDNVTKYFFETAVRFNNATAAGEALTYAFRNTRCDYFDGVVLKGAPFESADPIRELAGYLRFVDRGSYSGVHVLAEATSLGPTSAVATLCETSLSYGDWDMCDEIKVTQTEYTLDLVTGNVTVGKPVPTLSATGECH